MLLTAVLFTCVHLYGQSPGKPSVDLKTFVTREYIHGIPYEEAKAYGAKVLPELITMLNDKTYENHHVNVVSVMGRIGDKTAIKPLMSFLRSQKGEVNYETFITVLSIFQALGFIAQNNNEALQILSDWSNPDYVQKNGPVISYKNYKGLEMATLISRLAIQGLGVSGRTEALTLLQDINNPAGIKRLRFNPKLSNDTKSAIELNRQVKTQGVTKTFGKEGKNNEK